MITLYSIFISLPYIWKSSECIYGLIRLKKNKDIINTKSNNNISLIIAFKNEENNLNYLLKCILSQTYTPSEIILVNDHSTDNSCNIINSFIQENNIDITVLTNEGYGKKQALYTAVKYASGEYCLFTDADCTFSSKWIETYNSYINSNHAQLYISAVHETNNNTLSQQIQSIEFESLQAITAATCSLNKPIMCNGANMCVNRLKWLDIYSKYKLGKTKSGDDVFLLHSIKKEKGIIKYINKENSIVKTPTAPNISKFLKQRMRWGGKSIHYKDLNSISYACIVFIHCLLIIISAVISTINISIIIPFSILFTSKIIADFITLQTHNKINNLFINPFYIIFFSILHPIYITISALGGFLPICKWKN